MTSPASEKLTVVKIGGNVIDSEPALARVLDHFGGIPGKKLLVHGGGKLATHLAERLGLPQTLIEGRRVTDPETLKITVMVYAGLVNKTIVAGLQARGLNALGLTGADLDLIRAERRHPVPVDYGEVGDVKSVNLRSLLPLIDSGSVPVIAPLSHDGKGRILNTNADTIAYEIAKAFTQTHRVSLLFTFEKAGVLLDLDDERSLVPEMNEARFREMLGSGRIKDGMIPKLENAFRAIRGGVEEVILGQADRLPELLSRESGTRLHSE
jgi:acetylglutamate kinase